MPSIKIKSKEGVELGAIDDELGTVINESWKQIKHPEEEPDSKALEEDDIESTDTAGSK